MPRYCIALGCKSKGTPTSKFIFHRFPKDEKRKKQWLDSVPIKGKLHNFSSLCNLHFSPDDYGKRDLLKPNACPHVTTAEDKELPIEDNNDEVSCPKCKKSFVSEVALNNHARMEHVEAYLTGEERLCRDLLTTDIVTAENPDFAISPLVTSPGPEEVQACLGCLDTGVGQTELRGEMEEVFGQLTGLQIQGGSLCRICLQLLRKFSEFRQRCRDINEVLSEIPVVTEEALKNVDRKHLKHNYSRSDLIDIVCDPCIPEKSDTLIDETFMYMDYHTKIELDNDKYESVSDSDNELKDEFQMKDIDNERVNINDDIVTVVDEAANETNNHQEESDVDFICSENDDYLQEDDDAKINTTTTKQTNNKKKRKMCFNEAKKPRLEDEKLKHRRSLLVSPDNVPKGLIRDMFTLFDRLKECFRLEEDPFVLFERIRKESVLLKSGQSDGEETVSKSKNKGDKIKNAAWKRNVKEFLDLNNKYADVFGVDLDFVSLYEQQRAMDARRAQAAPAPFCGLCCKPYKHADTYERHLHFAHNKNHPMECSVCKYRLVSQQKLFTHLLTRHARRFTCRECGAAMFMGSESMNNVRRHVSMHHGQSFSCEFCGKKLATRSSYHYHLKYKHYNLVNSVKCPICDDTFYQSNGVRFHMIKKHYQAVQCVACGAWFEDRSALDTHTETGCQPGENSPCPGCGRNFESAALMKEHYLDVHKNYICEKYCEKYKCGKRIRGLQAYNAHMKESHGHPKKRRSMKSENSDKVKKKKKKKSYKKIIPSLACDVCGKNKFWSVADLRYHQRIHTGEKPYTCDYCSHQFRLKSSLRVHIKKIHLGEKCKPMGRLHLCDICGRSFSERGNVKAHKKAVHEGIKRIRSDEAKERRKMRRKLIKMIAVAS